MDQADTDGFLETVAEQEERSCVDYLRPNSMLAILPSGPQGPGIRGWMTSASGQDSPNLRLLRRAYAFFCAACFHFGSLKSFDRSLNVARCSGCHVATRHSVRSTLVCLRAR